MSPPTLPSPDKAPAAVGVTALEVPGPRYARHYMVYVLGMAFVLNVFNMTDRLVMGIVLEPIKLEFGLSDLQLGIMSGLAFTLVYSILGVPLGSLADRKNRRNIVAACVGIWSAMTVVTGMARSYVEIIIARAGVAFGEAGFTPAIHSMLSDYFPPSKRATALAIYGVGAPVGTLLAYIVGGYIAEHYNWRLVFIVVGTPGVLLALLMLFTIREPVRGQTESRIDNQAAPPISKAIQFAWQTRSIRYLMLGAGAHLLVFYGLSIWLAPFFVRIHGLSLSEAGFWLGIITGIFGGAATLVGGYMSDRLGRRNMAWYGWVPAVCLLLMLPFGIGMYLSPTASGALLLGCFVAFLGAIWLAPTFAVVQLVSPLRIRGVTAGVLIFTQNMIGLGVGPVLVGWLSDRLTPDFGHESLRWAMLAVFCIEIVAVAFYFAAGKWIAHDVKRNGVSPAN